MPIEVACPCGKRFRVRDELAGRRGKCSGCGGIVVIPQVTAPVAQDVADSPPDIYSVADEAPAPRQKWAAAPAVPVVPVAAVKPRRLAAAPNVVEFSRRSSWRDWLYLVLILALLPLVWSTFMDTRQSLKQRVHDTIAAHPEVRRSLIELREEGGGEREFFNVLPGHRLDGAWLAHDSEMHWLYALLAAAGFFGLALLMLPADSTKPLHAFFTGLFTGTAGVLLLLAVQYIAAWMRGRIIIPRSILGLFFLILKGIQLSYDMANDPSASFVPSVLGFTFGVGLCEELCKALPLLWHYAKKATLDWRGAALWGFLSGVGFGLSEAIMYSGDFYNGISGGDIYVVRFISCVGLHGIWAAAAGIFICKHQNLIQDAESWYGLFFNSIVLVAAPMVLHGLYDTMLKKEMNAAALVVAVISFGWLVFQVEQARRAEGSAGRVAYA